jgi:dual-specificity kinase
MSTPSTATATLPGPPHQPHYGYSHHQNYQANNTGYRANNSLSNGVSRLGGAYFPGSSSNLTSNGVTTANSARPLPVESQSHTIAEENNTSKYDTLSPAMPVSGTSSEQASRKRQRSREPDWNNFYKNGLPKEVIVIDDSPPPEESNSIEPLPVASSSRNQTSRTIVRATVHAAKKRKREDAEPTYEALYNGKNSDSTTNTPVYKDSPSGSTISTDRTTSALHTTAATSLGSQYSGNGAATNGFRLDEDVQPGQKRKRVATRQQIAQDNKRRELEIHGDAYGNYRPPPRPPLKSKEIEVKVLPDVSTPFSLLRIMLIFLELVHQECQSR